MCGVYGSPSMGGGGGGSLGNVIKESVMKQTGFVRCVRCYGLLLPKNGHGHEEADEDAIRESSAT